MDRLTLNSYAKVNLYLAVLNKRQDNYHNLSTVFERISLSDKIILKTRSDNRINFICNSVDLPKDPSRNLAYQAAKLLQETFKIPQGADIRLIKRIPVGSGLGGGSSNAAFVLLGLNKLWKLGLKPDKLACLGAKIGADVPFFIYETPFGLGEGRGDKVKPLNFNKLKLWHILIVPKLHVSTPLIYKKWDKLTSLRLTIPYSGAKILISALRKKDLSLIGKTLFNSLEAVTIRLYPKVSLVKKRLKFAGLKSILMSGSGPAVFGLASLRKEAGAIGRIIKRQNKSWKVFVVETV